MKKVEISTRSGEVYSVDLENIKAGDCYDCGRPDWAWEPSLGDENGFLSSVLLGFDGVEHVKLDRYHSDLCTLSPYRVISCTMQDGSEHHGDAVCEQISNAINNAVDYNDVDGKPYLFAEVDGEVIVIDGDEAWASNCSNDELRAALRLRALGQQVADLRGKAKLTQQQLSERAGVARCNIVKLERGYYNASTEVLGRIADALGKDIIIKNRKKTAKVLRMCNQYVAFASDKNSKS